MATAKQTAPLHAGLGTQRAGRSPRYGRALLIGGVVSLLGGALACAAMVYVIFGIMQPSSRYEATRNALVLGETLLILAFAMGGWIAARVARARRRTLLGLVLGVHVMLLAALIGAPALAQRTALHDVGVAIGVVDAPNVAVRTSAAIDALIEKEQGSDVSVDEGAYEDEARRTVAIVAFHFVLALSAILSGAVFGSVASAPVPGRRRWALFGIAVAIAATAGSGIALWPKIEVTYIAVFDTDQSAGPDLGVNLSEVVQHPEVMWGETVTVSAEIDRIVSPNAMVIGNDVLVVGDKLLVLAEEPLYEKVLLIDADAADLEPGRVVQVRGTVRPFDQAQLEQELGVDLSGIDLTEVGQKSVLVAREIDLDVPMAAESGDKEFSHTSGGYDLGVTITDVVGAPGQYIGANVTVSGEVEEHLLTEHAFLLDDAALLAVSPEPRPELFIEATAYVHGTVQIFNLAEFEHTYGVDLDDSLLAPYEGRVAIIVEDVALVK